MLTNTIKMAPKQGVAKTKSQLPIDPTKHLNDIAKTLYAASNSKQKVNYSDAVMEDPLITKFDNMHFNTKNTSTTHSKNQTNRRSRDNR